MSDKTVLDYTDEELAVLSNEELLKLKEEAIFGAENSHIGQLSKKYLINSLYGANANKFFPLYNPEIAASITANGRYFIRKTADYVEAALQKVLPSSKPYTVYGDTDSCVGSTIVKTSRGEIKIADLYESLEGDVEILKNNSYIKHVANDISVLSCSSKFETEYKPIKYVMKHTVKKRMYKISVNGKSVIITEDHSVMVKRNNKLISVKPREILKSDELIKIAGENV